MLPEPESPDRFQVHPVVVWLLKFGAVVVIVLLVAVYGARLARDLAADFPAVAETLPPAADSPLTVPAGASARAIGVLLEERGVVEDADEFEREVRRLGVADQLQAGEYVITATDMGGVIAALVAGPVPTNVYRLTVIEGLTLEEMVESIAEQTPYTREELEEALVDGSVTSVLLPDEAPADYPELTRWEGLLFPDTYEFLEDASAVDILSKLADTLVSRLGDQDWTAIEEAGFTTYEGLIIASLIEREAKLDEDRPLIGSVIYNRLDAGIALQIDSTILYALGERRAQVLFEDLEIDSPYNTYLFPGLPPTPIGGVRRASLEAAAIPAQTGFYYYVVVDASGRHGFSETLEEHNQKTQQAKDAGIIP